jgi:arylsulfatase A-like enzyme
VRRGAGIALASLFAVPACSNPAAPAKARNVLLVSIDSLRADRLGSHGNPRAVSPTLDRLAAEGVRFERALSPTSWTLPAHATLLSGQSQREHQVITTADRISSRSELLAEVFAREGYETVGVYAGPFLHPAYGFDRGFGEYRSCLSEATARLEGKAAWKSSHRDSTNACVEEAFAGWVERRTGRPFFAFVHMWDVHFDYIPPEPYASMFDPTYAGTLGGRDIAGKGFPLDAAPRDVEHLLALYEGELRYTDATVERLLAALRAKDLLEDTLVVVTSDHGEEFLEHGGKTHQQTLWEEVLHVPLIFWAPGRLLPAGRRVAEAVSLADVAPTITELVGLEGPARADGRSLVAWIRGTGGTAPPVFSALYRPGVPQLRLVSLRAGDIKLIHDPQSGSWLQFDLGADPRERHPLEVGDQGLRALLANQLAAEERAVAARDRAAPAARTPPGLPAGVTERLRELGYVE